MTRASLFDVGGKTPPPGYVTARKTIRAAKNKDRLTQLVDDESLFSSKLDICKNRLMLRYCVLYARFASMTSHVEQ